MNPPSNGVISVTFTEMHVIMTHSFDSRGEAKFPHGIPRIEFRYEVKSTWPQHWIAARAEAAETRYSCLFVLPGTIKSKFYMISRSLYSCHIFTTAVWETCSSSSAMQQFAKVLSTAYAGYAWEQFPAYISNVHKFTKYMRLFCVVNVDERANGWCVCVLVCGLADASEYVVLCLMHLCIMLPVVTGLVHHIYR